MKKTVVVLLHIGFWLCFFMIILIMLGIRMENNGEIDEAQFESAFEVIFPFTVFPAAFSFYTFYFLLFPRFLRHNKILLSVIVGAVIITAAVGMGYGMTPQSFIDTCGTENGEDGISAMLFFMVSVSTVSGVIALIIQGFATWFEEIKLKETLRQKNLETEMALVKSQLDPHFLFNTINNIDVLILKDAQNASEYLNKLSDIMRFMLYETKTDEIPISKEIEYIEKYIELQRIRTSNASYVNFTSAIEDDQMSIAPMLFIPFIENAFKHTTNKKLNNAIEIKIRAAKGVIEFECENKFDPNRRVNGHDNGLGNGLIKKRLNLMYPEQHTLKIVHENDFYGVYLTIQNGDLQLYHHRGRAAGVGTDA